MLRDILKRLFYTCSPTYRQGVNAEYENRDFHREVMTTLKTMEHKHENEIINVKNEVSASQDKLIDKLINEASCSREIIKRFLTTSESQLSSLIETNNKNLIRYLNLFLPLTFKKRVYGEESIIENFRTYITENNFLELYKSLVANLDNESITTVNSILHRVETADAYSDKLQLFTPEEINSLIAMYGKFADQTLKISDDCYAWSKYLLPVNHFEPCVFHYKCGLNEIDDPDRIRETTVIDAGAFIGDSALVFSPCAREVISFEPVPDNFEKLLTTIKLNDLTNIVPINLGLGAGKESRKIYFNASASGLVCRSDTEISINIISLDEYLQDRDTKIGLIKTDLEGFELEFLHGAIETIRKNKPILLISLYHTPEDFFTIKTFLEELDLGYSFRIRKPLDGHILLETCLVAE